MGGLGVINETIVCRAKLEDDCYDGSYMSRQLQPDPSDSGDDSLMSEDGTYDGRSIVCDRCYIRILPLTISGAALYDEIDEAIDTYRLNVEYIRSHDDPRSLADEAAAQAKLAREGSPRHRSALYMAELARREIKRRT